MIGSNRSKEDCNAPISSRKSVVDDPSNDYIMARTRRVSQRSMGDNTDMDDTYDDNFDDSRATMVGRTDECSPGSNVSASGSHSNKGSAFTNSARSSSSQSPSTQDEKQTGSDEYEEWTSQTSQISDASKQQEISSIDDNTDLSCDAGHTSLVNGKENSHDLLVGSVECPRRHLDETCIEPLSDTHIYMESKERSGYDLIYQTELDVEDRNGSVQQSQNYEEEEECDDCTTNRSMCYDGERSSLPIPQESSYRLPELQAAMIELSKQTVLPKETRAVLKVRIEEGAALGGGGECPSLGLQSATCIAKASEHW